MKIQESTNDNLQHIIGNVVTVRSKYHFTKGILKFDKKDNTFYINLIKQQEKLISCTYFKWEDVSGFEDNLIFLEGY